MPEPLRLLIAEDSPDDLALLEAELRAEGFEAQVHCVQTEADFLAALDRPWDLVILDYALPQFGARSALAMLHERDSELPVIVVSGTVNEQELVEAMKAGAGDYIQKQNLSRLGPAVRRELKDAAARRKRHRTEQALRESEERFRFVLEHAGVVFYRLRYSDMRYEYMSPGIEKLTGYTPEEIKALNFKSLVTPVAAPTEVVRARDTVRQERLAGRLHEHSADYQLRMRSGEPRWVTMHSLPWRDEQGNALGSVGLLLDITERRHMEERLRKSEEYFRSLIENASDLIAVLGRDGALQYVSPSLERILGERPEAQRGRLLVELVHPEDAARVERLFADVLRSERTSEPAPARLRHRDGSWRTLELVARRQADEAGAITVVLNGRDVTERESLEAQLLQAQKIEAVGRLAGGVAHDFNNLVTAILGYGDLMLRRMALDDPLRRNVEEIARAAERAAALTQQLLAFSRKQVLQPRVLDVREVLERMERLLRRLIGEDIELVVQAAAGLGPVRVDPVQIEQVLLNLAINARDAMPQGGRLILEAANADLDEAYAREHLGGRAGPFVMLAVSDSGHGMDRETQARIFEPFFTTKELGKGTGLGLSTVYGIVKQSGGYIWVYSEPGRGTTFKVYLPRVEESLEPVPDELAAGARSRGSETILLVEDDDAVRELVKELLETAGYKVLEAPRPADALRLVAEYAGPVHLLVTDVVMPQMGGPELAQRVRSLRPELKVLYVSGYSPGIVADRGVLEEGALFLQKPFSAEALETKVREALDH